METVCPRLWNKPRQDNATAPMVSKSSRGYTLITAHTLIIFNSALLYHATQIPSLHTPPIRGRTNNV